MIANTFLRSVYDRQQAALLQYGIALEEPGTEPITLEQARTHCRVDTFEEGSPPATVSDDDDWLETIGIPAARAYCEVELGRSLAPRIVRLTSSAFPSVTVDAAAGAAIPLPYGPVQSIVAITYLDQSAYDAAYDAAYQIAYDAEFGSSADPVAADAAGIAAGILAGDAALEQTLDPATYALDAVSVPARIVLAYGESWPTSLRTQIDSVRVEYVAGYSLAEDSPQAIKLPRVARAAMLVLLAHLYAHRGDEGVDIPDAVKSLLARVPGNETVSFA